MAKLFQNEWMVVGDVGEAQEGALFQIFSKTRKPREARNPRTGEKVQVGIKKSIAFRMAKDLKFRINSNRTPEEIDKIIEDMYDGKI